MNWKKIFYHSILILAIFGFTKLSFANIQSKQPLNTTSSGVDALTSQAASMGNTFLQDKLHDSKMPDWLRRTDINLGLAENLAPLYEITTIQPLFQGLSNTLFVQGHFGMQSSDSIYNLGFGWRYLTESKNWMPGINIFYDMTRKYHHQRVGVGGELFGKYMTLRANYYQAVSDRKLVAFLNGVSNYEQALNGVDYSIETPVPFLPWVSFTAQGYNWLGKVGPNVRGVSLFFRTAILRNLLVELGYDTSTGSVTTKKMFANFTMNFGAPDFVEHSAFDSFISKNAITARDVSAHRLEKVRRQNQIIVEKTSSGGGVGDGAFIIGRGSN